MKGGGILGEPSFEQRHAFLDAVQGPVQEVCPQYGIDPDKAIRVAATQSNWGRHVLGHNYWMMGGKGDAGWVTLMLIDKIDPSAPGGARTMRAKLAKYSSVQAAARAWCKAQR